MKTILLFLFLCCCSIIAKAQTPYLGSDETFANPDRGFYKFTETHSGNYTLLNQATVTGYRLNENITLIYRGFYLENFVNSNISQEYLDNMQLDFNVIRNAGIKVIVRFVYNNTPQDASKTRILSHINQLGNVLAENADVISTVQAGFIGSYGEWWGTTQAEFGGWGYNNTPLNATNYSNRREIVDALLDVLPENIMVQVRTPFYKMNMYASDPQSANAMRVGFHNDCFLASSDDVGTYNSSTIEQERIYMHEQTVSVPMNGETCGLNPPRSECTTAIDELTYFHWSSLNKDYNPDVLNSWIPQCYTQIENALGYRFRLISATLPDEVPLNQNLSFTLNLQNNGFAAPFNQRIAYIVLRNTITGQEFKAPLTSDPRTWLGPEELVITESLTFEGVNEGTYNMYLFLPDPDATLSIRPEYAIRFANENMWEPTTGYNNLNHTVTVEPPLGLQEHLTGRIVVSPVPANNVLAVSLTIPGSYSVIMMNTLGQEVSSYSNVSQGITMPVSNLPEGIYYVKISGNSDSMIKRIIVKHD
ncbi:DUF4832 domain-containing protein [Flavobacterium sp. DGU11]|uniref:DUF4832 domain-containing protein n=1 Tax=Flavobacterium arundinis TaxID=3139143 RepID=A0ABU9HZM9_9FLAO